MRFSVTTLPSLVRPRYSLIWSSFPNFIIHFPSVTYQCWYCLKEFGVKKHIFKFLPKLSNKSNCFFLSIRLENLKSKFSCLQFFQKMSKNICLLDLTLAPKMGQSNKKSVQIRGYLLDVLWWQPIKLIHVVSTSEFHEYWWNDIDFIFLSPPFSAGPQKPRTSTASKIKYEKFWPKI